MRFFKFSSWLCVVLLTANVNSYALDSSVESVCLASSEAGGIIAIDDVIMAVTVNDWSNKIVQVIVFDEKQTPVFQSGGCSSGHCTFDLSRLPKGMYAVVVQTHKGDSFSAEIQL